MSDAAHRVLFQLEDGELIELRPCTTALLACARARKLRSEARTHRIKSRLLRMINERVRERGEADLEVPPPPDSGVRLRS